MSFLNKIDSLTQVYEIIDNYIRNNPNDLDMGLGDLIHFAIGDSNLFSSPKEEYSDDKLRTKKLID